VHVHEIKYERLKTGNQKRCIVGLGLHTYFDTISYLLTFYCIFVCVSIK